MQFTIRHQFCYHQKGSSILRNRRPMTPDLRGLGRQGTDTILGTYMLMRSMQGLMQASEQHGFEGEGFSYLKSPIWWGGVVTRTEIINIQIGPPSWKR